jgi:hypothetical protein
MSHMLHKFLSPFTFGAPVTLVWPSALGIRGQGTVIGVLLSQKVSGFVPSRVLPVRSGGPPNRRSEKSQNSEQIPDLTSEKGVTTSQNTPHISDLIIIFVAVGGCRSSLELVPDFYRNYSVLYDDPLS